MSANADMIHIKVKSQTQQDEVHFKIKRNTPLRKLMEKYAERVGATSIATLTFLFEGERVMPDNTPAQLSMQDNDTLEVAVTQIGGGNN